jgi:hypothetical protein
MDQQFLESIASKLNLATEEMVEKTVNEMLTSDVWVEKIQQMATQRILDRVASKISSIDVNVAIKNAILENKDQIVSEFGNNFKTKSIVDAAESLQLTVMNEAVVVEHELHTSDLNVERNTHLKGDVLVDGSLAIKGRVNVDNASWQELANHIGDKTYTRVKNEFQDSVVESVIDRAKEGMQFDNIVVNGEQLLVDDALASGIKKSNLNTVGTLNGLSVKGRLGINTESPTDALSVWDEEVSLCAGKLSNHTGYIGTAKNQNLVIGTNKQRQLEVSKEGGVWVESLTIGKHKISHERSVPNYAGTKGDIVFNIDFKTDEPFAWVCLGNYRWQELRSA